MKNKICSILIPVYNGEKFIEKTINSCLKQTYKDIEIIVVDDCSKDNSANIIDKLSSNYSQIQFIKNKSNLGINKSINHCASISKGDYLLFLGHDDMLKENHIENMLSYFDNDTAVVHCNANIIDENGNFIKVATDDDKQIKNTKIANIKIAKRNIIHSTGTIISKKHYLIAGGWDESFKNYGEWLLWIKLISLGTIKYNSNIKALYRRHTTNITNTFKSDETQIPILTYNIHCHKTALNNLELNFSKKINIYYTIIRKYFKLYYFKFKYN